MAEKTAKHYRAEALIDAGGATTESLCESLEVNEKGLASQFYYMRLRGIYPIKQKDKTFLNVDEDAWDVIQEERAANRKPVVVKTPEERLEAATKRVAKSEKAVKTADTRNDKDPSTKNGLLAQRADIEFQLANLELEDAQEAVDEA